MTSPAPPPSGQYTPGTIPNPLSPSQDAGAVAAAISGVVQGIVGTKLGQVSNLLNIALNTLLYGSITALGLYMTYKGLRLLATEIPGAEGVANTLTAPIRKVGSTVKSVATTAAAGAVLL